AGCPVCSSSADGFDAWVPHLAARDATFLCISRAPLDKLQAYKQRMGWGFEWVSSADSDFNFDFETSRTPEQVKPWVESGQLPQIVHDNAAACGTDAAAYIAEGPVFNAFALDGDDVYQTYSTTARGLEFMMGYYWF